jgi:hypothetical protein
MKKTILTSAFLAMAGVGLMAGSAMATAYATEGWEAYEYYQKTTNDPNGFLGQFMVEGDSEDFYFDLAFTNPPGGTTTSDLTFIDDVSGYGPFGKPVDQVWASVTILSVDEEWDGFDLDVTAYSNNNTYELAGYADANSNVNIHTFTFTFSGDLLAAWQADPFGNLKLSVFAAPAVGGFGTPNDFNLLEVGVGVTPVPEPATMLLFGTGIASLAGVIRRRRNK